MSYQSARNVIVIAALSPTIVSPAYYICLRLSAVYNILLLFLNCFLTVYYRENFEVGKVSRRQCELNRRNNMPRLRENRNPSLVFLCGWDHVDVLISPSCDMSGEIRRLKNWICYRDNVIISCFNSNLKVYDWESLPSNRRSFFTKSIIIFVIYVACEDFSENAPRLIKSLLEPPIRNLYRVVICTLHKH